MNLLKRFFRFVLLYILTTILLVAGLVTYIFIDNNTIELNKYTIFSQKIPPAFNGYKFLIVSDYHNAPYVEKVVKKAKSAKPDVIVITGDFTTRGERHMDNSLILAKQLCEIAPTYAVTGNHEEYAKDFAAFIKKFEDLGVKYLNNEKVELKKEGASIFLYGIRDSSHTDLQLQNDPYRLLDKLEKTGKELDPSRFNVLLAHRANQFEEISKFDFDLVFSGHLHGGVVRLPFVGGVFSNTAEELFPKYTAGIYTLNQSKMVVSRGLDKQFNKLRIFNGPELVLVTIKR